METIIPINIAPRASRPRSATESRAPFAIEAREERITMVEEFEEFRLAGMCDRPAAAACEKAVPLREVAHQATLHHPMKTKHSAFPGVVEKMIENVPGELPLTGDLHYFTNRARFDVMMRSMNARSHVSEWRSYSGQRE